MTAPPKLYTGWYELLPDPSLNFQLNRWAAYGGPSWINDVRPVLPKLQNYDEWRSVFVALGERALSDSRVLHAALHFRCAEFFMAEADPRRRPLRHRLLGMLRDCASVPQSACTEVAFDGLRLPAWHFQAATPRRTAVVFGGFDSYIEEFFPIFANMSAQGWNVIGFEGPGQGAVLEEQHAPMITDWHRVVGAILDAFNLDDVTLIGVSLGGCLAIRAAAFEPRIGRVVAFDVLADLFQIMSQQQAAPISFALRGLLAMGARRVVDESAATLAQHSPQLEWALSQAKRVFGHDSPTDVIEATRKFQTKDISFLVRQDALLMVGTGDHYIPLEQLWEQQRLLTSARSITSRIFTAEEHAQAHCQIGNLPLAIRTITEWDDSMRRRSSPRR